MVLAGRWLLANSAFPLSHCLSVKLGLDPYFVYLCRFPKNKTLIETRLNRCLHLDR